LTFRITITKQGISLTTKGKSMNKLTAYFFTMVLLITGPTPAETSDQQAVEIGQHKAVTPVARTPDWWMPRQQANKERIGQGGVDLLMLGDSITHGWERVGINIWQLFYADRNAVNMGFSGDKTEHVLWRIGDIDFATITPKLAVLMVGTNNSSDAYTSAQIADGIVAIARLLRLKLPDTRVLILNIFPRGSGPRDIRKSLGDSIRIGSQWEKVNEASMLAAKQVVDNEWVYFLDINARFLDREGTLSRDVMPDLLHLSEKGYALWAAAMEPTLKTLLGE
jgi:beta-glucosidase